MNESERPRRAPSPDAPLSLRRPFLAALLKSALGLAALGVLYLLYRLFA